MRRIQVALERWSPKSRPDRHKPTCLWPPSRNLMEAGVGPCRQLFRLAGAARRPGNGGSKPRGYADLLGRTCDYPTANLSSV